MPAKVIDGLARWEGGMDGRATINTSPAAREGVSAKPTGEVKSPAESKGDWDCFKQVSTISPEDAWRPLAKGGCPFVKG